MSKKREKPRVISSELKAKILLESYKPGCVISDLARSYGLEVSRLYGWRSECNKHSVGSESRAYAGQKITVSPEAKKFVELTLDEPTLESLSKESPIFTPKSPGLKKAILIFGSFSLTIEGNFSNDTMLNILKIEA